MASQVAWKPHSGQIFSTPKCDVNNTNSLSGLVQWKTSFNKMPDFFPYLFGWLSLGIILWILIHILKCSSKNDRQSLVNYHSSLCSVGNLNVFIILVLTYLVLLLRSSIVLENVGSSSREPQRLSSISTYKTEYWDMIFISLLSNYLLLNFPYKHAVSISVSFSFACL